MRSFSFVVSSEVGLHARPASRLVACAHEFDCDIQLYALGGHCNAKSIFEVLLLDVGCGARVTVICEGDDEDEAVVALEELCAQL